jgi:hypothetical protein
LYCQFFILKEIKEVGALFVYAVESGLLPKHHLLFQMVKTLRRAIVPTTKPFYDEFPNLSEALMTLKYKFGGGVIKMLSGGTVPVEQERDAAAILKHKSIIIPAPDSPGMRIPSYSLIDRPSWEHFVFVLQVARVLCKGGQLNYFALGNVTSIVATLSCDETLMVKSLEYDNNFKVICGLVEPRMIDASMLSTPAQRNELQQQIVNNKKQFLNSVLVVAVEFGGPTMSICLPIVHHWNHRKLVSVKI